MNRRLIPPSIQREGSKPATGQGYAASCDRAKSDTVGTVGLHSYTPWSAMVTELEVKGTLSSGLRPASSAPVVGMQCRLARRRGRRPAQPAEVGVVGHEPCAGGVWFPSWCQSAVGEWALVQ